MLQLLLMLMPVHLVLLRYALIEVLREDAAAGFKYPQQHGAWLFAQNRRMKSCKTRNKQATSAGSVPGGQAKKGLDGF